MNFDVPILTTPLGPLDFDPDEEERWHDSMANGSEVGASRGASRTRWNAVDLMAEDFPEPRWAVPGILAEGLNLLCGPPKVGKSWAALGLAAAIASGGRALGTIPVDPGPVLYLALEDQPRRLQCRLRTVFGEKPPPEGLDIWTECERLPEGGDTMRDWLDQQSTARLLAVDVFARVRPPADAKSSTYEADYLAMAALKRIADDYGVCLLVVHHVRKATAEDFLDAVSGTNGLAGAADGILVLRRSRGSADGELHITGRDVQEDKRALSWEADLGAWKLLDGPAEDYALHDTRRTVLQLLREQDGLTPKAIADTLALDYELVKKTVQRMVTDQQLDTDGAGHYFPPVPMSLLSPESP